MDSYRWDGLGDDESSRAEYLLIELPHRSEGCQILRRAVRDEATALLAWLAEVLCRHAREAKNRAQHLGAQHIVEVEYRIKVLVSEPASIAQ